MMMNLGSGYNISDIQIELNSFKSVLLVNTLEKVYNINCDMKYDGLELTITSKTGEICSLVNPINGKILSSTSDTQTFTVSKEDVLL